MFELEAKACRRVVWRKPYLKPGQRVYFKAPEADKIKTVTVRGPVVPLTYRNARIWCELTESDVSAILGKNYQTQIGCCDNVMASWDTGSGSLQVRITPGGAYIEGLEIPSVLVEQKEEVGFSSLRIPTFALFDELDEAVRFQWNGDYPHHAIYLHEVWGLSPLPHVLRAKVDPLRAYSDYWCNLSDDLWLLQSQHYDHVKPEHTYFVTQGSRSYRCTVLGAVRYFTYSDQADILRDGPCSLWHPYVPSELPKIIQRFYNQGVKVRWAQSPGDLDYPGLWRAPLNKQPGLCCDANRRW